MTSTSPSSLPSLPDRSFFSKLFDFSFASFVTTNLISLLYVIAMVGAGLSALSVFGSFVAYGGAYLVLGLILAPIAFVVMVLFARVWMELIIVQFRTAENTSEMVRLLRERP